MATEFKDRVAMRSAFRPPFHIVVVWPPDRFMDGDEVVLDAYRDWLREDQRPGAFAIRAFRKFCMDTHHRRNGVTLCTPDANLAFEFKIRWG